MSIDAPSLPVIPPFTTDAKGKSKMAKLAFLFDLIDGPADQPVPKSYGYYGRANGGPATWSDDDVKLLQRLVIKAILLIDRKPSISDYRCIAEALNRHRRTLHGFNNCHSKVSHDGKSMDEEVKRILAYVDAGGDPGDFVLLDCGKGVQAAIKAKADNENKKKSEEDVGAQTHYQISAPKTPVKARTKTPVKARTKKEVGSGTNKNPSKIVKKRISKKVSRSDL